MNKLDVSRRILFGVLVAAGLVSMAMAPLTLGGTISFVHGFWVAAALLLLAIVVSPKEKWTRVLALVVLLCAWMMYRSHRDGLAQLQRWHQIRRETARVEIERLKQQVPLDAQRPVPPEAVAALPSSDHPGRVVAGLGPSDVVSSELRFRSDIDPELAKRYGFESRALSSEDVAALMPCFLPFPVRFGMVTEMFGGGPAVLEISYANGTKTKFEFWPEERCWRSRTPPNEGLLRLSPDINRVLSQFRPEGPPEPER